MGDLFSHPAVVGILIGFPSVALGYLVYLRSKKSDRITAEKGTIGAVYEGLDKIITNLQGDNKELRERVDKLDDIESSVRVLLNRVALLERYIINAGGTIPKNGL